MRNLEELCSSRSWLLCEVLLLFLQSEQGRGGRGGRLGQWFLDFCSLPVRKGRDNKSRRWRCDNLLFFPRTVSHLVFCLLAADHTNPPWCTSTYGAELEGSQRRIMIVQAVRPVSSLLHKGTVRLKREADIGLRPFCLDKARSSSFHHHHPFGSIGGNLLFRNRGPVAKFASDDISVQCNRGLSEVSVDADSRSRTWVSGYILLNQLWGGARLSRKGRRGEKRSAVDVRSREND